MLKINIITITSLKTTNISPNSFATAILSFTAPIGYKPLCVASIHCDNWGQILYDIHSIGNDYVNGCFKNTTTSNCVIGNVEMKIIFVNSSFIK